MTVTPNPGDTENVAGGHEGVQTEFASTGGDNAGATTYPESWQANDLPMPGTVTQAPGHEHENAVEQQYYLQDEADPVTKGDHHRRDFSGGGG